MKLLILLTSMLGLNAYAGLPDELAGIECKKEIQKVVKDCWLIG